MLLQNPLVLEVLDRRRLRGKPVDVVGQPAAGVRLVHDVIGKIGELQVWLSSPMVQEMAEEFGDDFLFDEEHDGVRLLWDVRLEGESGTQEVLDERVDGLNVLEDLSQESGGALGAQEEQEGNAFEELELEGGLRRIACTLQRRSCCEVSSSRCCCRHGLMPR